MQLSLLTLASLVSAALAEFKLRAAVNQLWSSSGTKAETYGARIVVGGLDAAAELDVKFVAQQAMAAFNEAFGFDKAGHKIGYILADSAFPIPSDSWWWTGESPFVNAQRPAKQPSDVAATLIDAKVEVWSYDDGFPAVVDAPEELLKQLEHDFCHRLRRSGFPSLAHAHDCSFSLYGTPDAARSLISMQATYPLRSEAVVAEAQLYLTGLPDHQRLTRNDVDWLNEVVIETHQQAFQESGLTLSAFQVVADLHNRGAATVLVAHALPLRSRDAVADSNEAGLLHKAFETLLCASLRNSANPTFETVQDCSFNFVFAPAGN